MYRYCAARRFAVSALRARSTTPAQQIQRRAIATQPPTVNPQKISKSAFFGSVALIGGLTGVGAAFVTTPVE